MESIQRQQQGFRHPSRWNSVPVPAHVAERAYTNVDIDENGCWISRYSVASHGYAQIGWQVRPKGNRMVLAHRASWVHVNGQMPLGMTLDHTCKARRCVNPAHLRLLPNYENARRVDGRDWPMGECANGHPNSELVEHSARDKQGNRRTGTTCRVCSRLYAQRGNWRARHPHEPMPTHLLLRSETAA